MWIYPANEGKSHERENDTVVVGARRIDVQRMTGKACCGCSMWVRSCLQRPNSITLSRWKTGRRSDRKPGFRQVRAGLPPCSSRQARYQLATFWVPNSIMLSTGRPGRLSRRTPACASRVYVAGQITSQHIATQSMC